ncbi:hypothetical protein IF2G_01620 [Cordyceps javanica]|nr:hypothetical protein IF2G_01620 [Cordyceps javanica]
MCAMPSSEGVVALFLLGFFCLLKRADASGSERYPSRLPVRRQQRMDRAKKDSIGEAGNGQTVTADKANARSK